MKVSTEWLSDYISLDQLSAEELAERITRSGIEIDQIENRNKGVTGVVVGYVKSKEKHPDADKLNVCIVDAGLEEELQIVCGAKNVDAGQKVPVALVGAKLPGGLDIKKSKAAWCAFTRYDLLSEGAGAERQIAAEGPTGRHSGLA